MMTADAVGGVWRHALDLSAALAARGWRVTLAVSGPAPDAEQAREAEAVAGLAREVGADLVHLNSPSEAGRTNWPTPLVVTVHSCLATWWRTVRGGPPPAEWAARIARAKRGLERADALAAPSRAFAAMVADAYGAALAPLAIHNGAAPVPHVAAEKREVVLTAGRLWDDGKNVALLDSLAGDLAWPVVAAGPSQGPNGARLQAERLTLLGLLPHAELRARMREAAIYAAPALYEPFGLAVLEAAQAGCALVLSDIPTFRELWDGAATFADPRDPAAFRDALQSAIRDPLLRASLGEAARERARAYTLDAQGAAFDALYRRLLAPALKRAV